PKGSVLPAKNGDVVKVESSLEMTTRETAQNTLVWVDIFVSQDRNAISPASEAYDMGAQGGTNITPNQHHYTFEPSGHVTIPPTSTTGPWHWIYVIWCGCLASATPSGRRGNQGPRRRRRLSVDSPPRGEVRSTFP